MKKRLIGAMLAMAMATTMLGGCGSTASTDTAPAEGTEATDTADAAEDSGKIQVAFVPQLIGIPYFTAMDEGGFGGNIAGGKNLDVNGFTLVIQPQVQTFRLLRLTP